MKKVISHSSTEEETYLNIGKKIKEAQESQLFGKPCFKINGKAFICFFQNCMVFKLTGSQHSEALNLSESQLFDPSGKKRPMKEWVQISRLHEKLWPKYAKAALSYVKANN